MITDLDESRLAFARRVVPGVKCVKVQREWSAKEVAGRVKEAAGCGVRVALECTGVESSVHAAIYVRPSFPSPCFYSN